MHYTLSLCAYLSLGLKSFTFWTIFFQIIPVIWQYFNKHEAFFMLTVKYKLSGLLTKIVALFLPTTVHNIEGKDVDEAT